MVAATDEPRDHRGYNGMSFSDIAAASGIPRGNLNYHFKTKQQVPDAVIEHRVRQMRVMLEGWDQNLPDPLRRLQRFAHIPLNERAQLRRFGCPMGSLNTELGKHQPDLQALSQRQFDVFREWLRRQFRERAPGRDADHLALPLLVRTQGLAVLAQAYADPALVEREVDGIERWLDDLASPARTASSPNSSAK